MLHAYAAFDLFLAIVAFAIVLIPAIILHELGHFLAAKLAGINVLEFGIGFPPRVGRLFMLGETEFTLNWLPIGGFVRPLGEDMIGPADEDKVKRDRVILEERRSGLVRIVTEREMLRLRGVDDRKMMSVNEAPPLGRIFFMLAGALANFATAILLFFIAALIGLSLPVGGLVALDAIPPGSLFDGGAAQAGDVIEMIDGARFEDFQSFQQALAEHRGGAVSFTLRSGQSGEQYKVTVPSAFEQQTGIVQVLSVTEDSPAAAAGIVPGDLVAEIERQPLPPSPDPSFTLSEAAREAAGRPLTLTLLREADDGDLVQFNVSLIPRVEPPADEGRLGIGIRSQLKLGDWTRFANAGKLMEHVPQSPVDAILYSLITTGKTLNAIASIPGQLLDGSLSGGDARPISIIGISKIGGDLLQRSLREGPQLMLHFVALVSIFLGVSNLLPIPALDGGRIVFVLIEMLRGKPVDPKVEAKIHMVGMALLLGLGSLVMLYDLINPPSIP